MSTNASTARAGKLDWVGAALRRLTGLGTGRLPASSALLIAGLVVGFYSGLAAGLFSALIGLVSGLCLGLERVLDAFHAGSPTAALLRAQLAQQAWHLEYAWVGVPFGALALGVAARGVHVDPRVRRRLRVLGSLVWVGVALYYPLVALSALDVVFGRSRDVVAALAVFPWWAKLLTPALGGAIVGHLLRGRPRTHGHGVPEVVAAIDREEPLVTSDGAMKLVASAVTIGSGGSAGREGPVVYGGAAIGSAVARALGFSGRELAILLACGAGGGIAASFDAPIAGAIFAMEVILRNVELRSFSPLILGSVTATLVARSTMGTARWIENVRFELVSGWEILSYAALGVLCGGLSFLFLRFLHRVEDFCAGRLGGGLSQRVARWPRAARAGVGGLLVGAMAVTAPAVWGLGQDFVPAAIAGELTLAFLLTNALFKLLASGITLGSGGAGGTFTPATVIGGLAGGAFGMLVHGVFPGHTAVSGAYAMVGVGGMISGLTRGPLTGLMMVYELSGHPSMILALMVTCSLSSHLCHHWLQRHALTQGRARGDLPLVGDVAVPAEAVALEDGVQAVADKLRRAEVAALPVVDGAGKVVGIVAWDALRDVLHETALYPLLRAADLAQTVETVQADTEARSALRLMDGYGAVALPVVDERDPAAAPRMVTRAALLKRLAQSEGDAAAPAEMSR